MGEHLAEKAVNRTARAAFIRRILEDIEAMDTMLEQNMFETGITRIGAEQEFAIVNESWRPSNLSETLLAAIDDPHFTTELARFNLEANLDPLELKGKCFTDMHDQLSNLIRHAREVSSKHNTKIILTGILPTISKNELEIGYMSPNPRYSAINEMMKEIRGGDFQLYLHGLDELFITHDSLLFEACNTSFQLHLQIEPDDFISSFNWSQAISGPIMAVSTNSPLLMGRELWSETRIALFRQSIDTRNSTHALKDQKARVSFGYEWAEGKITDIFRKDLATHKVILAKDVQCSSLEELDDGKIPKLEAMCLHNGTIYRWNRPCYGVGGGKPHLRIENRYIPSGPTTADEMAAFVFWVGLMKGRPKQFDHMPSAMDFRDAKANFIRAALSGKGSIMYWKGNEIPAKDLVVRELLPMAYYGLADAGVDKEDANYYLELIEKRIKGHTGSEWMVRNFRNLRKTMKKDEALITLTKAMHENQEKEHPISDWPMIETKHPPYEEATLVGHIMTTELLTINENDLADLATHIMKWNDIHHVPVENNQGKLTGILTWTHMKKHLRDDGREENIVVSDIMEENVTTVMPATPIGEAIQIMKSNEIGCLPVIQDEQIVGIVTIEDLIRFDNA